MLHTKIGTTGDVLLGLRGIHPLDDREPFGSEKTKLYCDRNFFHVTIATILYITVWVVSVNSACVGYVWSCFSMTCT